MHTGLSRVFVSPGGTAAALVHGVKVIGRWGTVCSTDFLVVFLHQHSCLILPCRGYTAHQKQIKAQFKNYIE